MVGWVLKKENFPSNEQKDGMYYAKGKSKMDGMETEICLPYSP